MTKNIIILFASGPVLNPDSLKIFANLSAEYSAFLNTLLISNWIENLTDINSNSEIKILMSKEDKEFIPRNFFPEQFKRFFYNSLSPNSFNDNNSEQLSTNSTKLLLLFHSTIGMNKNDIQRVLSLAQTDEASIVIGKSEKNKIVFTCFAGSDNQLTEYLLNSKKDYDKLLSQVTSKDILINTLDGFLSIDDFEDIKKLYIELSKKESLLYCSQKMHENFNDLFIEYKELLNV